MKLTLATKRTKGMTLLELTVVILVLLSLISILFVGARAWKKGSDRAASVLTIRNVQQAVRSLANMNNLNAGQEVDSTDLPGTGATVIGSLFGPEKFMESNPVDGNHPAGTDYDYAIAEEETIPAVGTLYMRVSGGTDPTEYEPKESEIGDW